MTTGQMRIAECGLWNVDTYKTIQSNLSNAECGMRIAEYKYAQKHPFQLNPTNLPQMASHREV
jgi:hypothetical protein